GLMPAAIIAQCSPAVPDETPIAWRRLVNAATRRSNSSIFGPIESVALCNTSTTTSISACVMSGRDAGIGEGRQRFVKSRFAKLQAHDLLTVAQESVRIY